MNKKRRGRPLTAEQIQMIRTLSGYGLKVQMVAHCLGMSKRTLERRIEQTPAARGALSKGRAVAASNVTQTAFQMATSGKCPALTIFWLKTRLGWKDVSTHEHRGDPKRPIVHEEYGKLSEQELDQKFKERIARWATEDKK